LNKLITYISEGSSGQTGGSFKKRSKVIKKERKKVRTNKIFFTGISYTKI
jgi:hypothetical protein